MAGASRETRSGLAPVAWTREQIEAWVRYDGELHLVPPEWRRVAVAARRAIVRLCPEAPDYNALNDKIDGINTRSHKWMETATDDEIAAWAEETVVKLWSRSLSEPVEGDAPSLAQEEQEP